MKKPNVTDIVRRQSPTNAEEECRVPNNKKPADDHGLVFSPSKKRFAFLSLSLKGFVVTAATLAVSTGVVYAALTFTGTGITSDQSLNLTGVSTSTFDFGSSTFQLHTANNGPITTGNGLFFVGGSLKVNNTSTLNGNVYTQGPNPRIDVSAYGAKCDGVTDDTTAIQNAINALPANGGVLSFPPTGPAAGGGCKITSLLTVTNLPNVRFVGTMGHFIFPGAVAPGSFILCTQTVTGCLDVASSSSGFMMDSLGIKLTSTVGDAFYAVKDEGGTAVFYNDKIINFNGATGGPKHGDGILMAVDGDLLFETYITGFNIGVEINGTISSGCGVTITGNSRIYGGNIGVVAGSGSTVACKLSIFESDIETMATGDIFLQRATTVDIRDNYLELQASASPYFVKVGDTATAFTVSGVMIESNYFHCNSDTTSTTSAIQLRYAKGVTISNNVLDGTCINESPFVDTNGGSHVSNVTWMSNTSVPPDPPSPIFSSTSGVTYSDDPGAPTFYTSSTFNSPVTFAATSTFAQGVSIGTSTAPTVPLNVVGPGTSTIQFGDASSSKPACFMFSQYPTGTSWAYAYIQAFAWVVTSTPCN